MTLLFDMPMAELEVYSGRNPKPADFDAFWDRSLAELAAVDPAVVLEPAGFETPFAECFHMYFTGIGGARIYAKLVRPKHRPAPGPAVLQFHGYSGSIAGWAEESKLAFAAAGITYAGMDCRGQGGLSEDPGGVTGPTLNGHIIRGLFDALDGRPEKFAFRQIFLDTVQLARIVRGLDYVDADRVGVFGGSQGGALTVACGSLVPELKRLAPVYPFLSDYQRVWEMEQARAAYAELKEWFRRFDPLHERENDVFTALGYIDIQHLASRIRGDVLWTIGLTDEICPPSTQFAAYNKITASKSMRIYPDYGHENMPGRQDTIYQYMLGL